MRFQRGQPRPANAGRKKGSKNKNSVPAQELADLLGINPCEVLLHFAAGNAKELGLKSIPWQARARAAAEATRYIHAQRRSVDLNVAEPIHVIIEDFRGKDRKEER